MENRFPPGCGDPPRGAISGEIRRNASAAI
jgi:hypothetical protein